MAAGGAWKRTRRVNGSDAGRLAKPVWVCSNCLCQHRDLDSAGKLIKPWSCKFCQQTAFDYFHSTGEATCWAYLHRRVRAKELRNLQRQVIFDLLTVGRDLLPCKWAQLVLDFTYDELSDDGEWFPVWADYKPSEGISPDAVLKIRCLEKMGYPVTILTQNGEV